MKEPFFISHSPLERESDGTEQQKRRGACARYKTTGGGMVMKTLLMVFFLSILLLFNTPMAIAQFSEAGVEQFKVAVNAPDFTLRKLGGGDLSLKDLKGKVIIMNFFATY